MEEEEKKRDSGLVALAVVEIEKVKRKKEKDGAETAWCERTVGGSPWTGHRHGQRVWKEKCESRSLEVWYDTSN